MRRPMRKNDVSAPIIAMSGTASKGYPGIPTEARTMAQKSTLIRNEDSASYVLGFHPA